MGTIYPHICNYKNTVRIFIKYIVVIGLFQHEIFAFDVAVSAVNKMYLTKN